MTARRDFGCSLPSSSGFPVKRLVGIALAVVLLLVATLAVIEIESVQETEHCVKLRYGRVAQERMPTVVTGWSVTASRRRASTWSSRTGTARAAVS